MRFSLQFIVSVVVLLLALASIVAFYFAIGREFTIPLLLVAVVNLEAVAILVFLVTRGIISPLKKIRDVIKKVGGGDFETRIALLPTREMQELGTALNEMITRLRTSTQELQEAKSGLELRVAERTQELRELASSLEEKVKQRTQELQERLLELERFEKLAIGRELKMIELKEEVKRIEDLVPKKKTNVIKSRGKSAA